MKTPHDVDPAYLTARDNQDGREKCACGRPATANGRECPQHFRERIRSVNLDGSVTPTKTKVNHYDRESVQAVFGENAREQMMEETDGMGYARTAADGTIYHRNRHSGDVEAVSDKELESTYMRGIGDD